MTDIEIAHSVQMKEIGEIAAKIGIPAEDLEQYGHHIAKIPASLAKRPQRGKLILVTAITATKAGIGKSTTSIGLGLGMEHIGKKAIVALREPSLGPCFGMKGGAAGGGWAQVLPMEKINLHFTGDFHAITSAHNMIAALLDNYIYQHQSEGFALKEVLWKRVLDVNDRSLRSIVTGLGPRSNGLPAESGFDITPASEIMAILCLCSDLEDLQRRIGRIILGYRFDGSAFTVDDLGVTASIAVLLKDAINPNLVQTTEGTPAIIHGGPFANIAHGCNSVIATKAALACADYVITEAGFGADLGAEKFYDIKCRLSGLNPDMTILVASLNGLKMHGDVALDQIHESNPEGVVRGFANLDRHIANIKSYGQHVLVCLNSYSTDTPEEVELLRAHCAELGVDFAINSSFANKGAGAADLAREVVRICDNEASGPLQFPYSDEEPLKKKIEAVATKIYGAARVSFSSTASSKLALAESLGLAKCPVCIAKTQYSFSQDPKRYGAPSGFDFEISDIVLNAGSGMVVAIAGSIIRMPGLPKSPQALRIGLDENGEITGLS